jgi:hypothetical protein
MKMEWENELKQDLPNVEKRMSSNFQQVRTKIQTLRNGKKRTTSWFSVISAVSIMIAFTIFITLANQWNSKNIHKQQASNTTPSELSGAIKTSFVDNTNFMQSYGDLIREHFPKLQTSFIDPSMLTYDENYRESYDSIIEKQTPGTYFF